MQKIFYLHLFLEACLYQHQGEKDTKEDAVIQNLLIGSDTYHALLKLDEAPTEVGDKGDKAEKKD